MIDNDNVCPYVCDYVDDDVGIKITTVTVPNCNNQTYERNYD